MLRYWEVSVNDENDDNQETYYEKNKSVLLEYAHRYYAINRQTILLKKKLYNEKKENKDRRREYMKRYYRTHKEKFHKNEKRN